MSRQQIYLMKNDLGLYKIGISKNPTKRAKEVSCASGMPTQLLMQWQSYNAYDTEQRLHKIFKDKRKSGEWFKFTKKDLPLIGKYISAFDNLISHDSDMTSTITTFKPNCHGLKFLITKKFSTNTIEDYINIRDFQYAILNKEFKHKESYFALISDLKCGGYYIPHVWELGTSNGIFSSLYEPTLSYFHRGYPICTMEEKAKLDILYTESYLEDLEANRLHMQAQLEAERKLLQEIVKLNDSTP